MWHFKNNNMRQLAIILTVWTLTVLVISCNQTDNSKMDSEKRDTIVTPTEPDNSATIIKTDTISIWTYDYEKSSAIKNREIDADMLTPKKLVDFINVHKGREKVHLDFVKVSHDTIFVRIKESTYLTQQMGTSGADDFMTTTTFTLTELKNIKFVTYAFEEGDHAVPGTYSRQYYIDRNKRIDSK